MEENFTIASNNHTGEEKKGRIVWIDELKAIGMLFVMVGHIPSKPYWLYVWIYSFHMPLFFLVSGMTVKIPADINFKEYTVKKIKSLLFPYFYFNITMFPLWALYYGVSGANMPYILETFLGIFTANTKIYNMLYDAMWFLPTLFLSVMIFSAILKLCKNNLKLATCMVIVCVVISYFDIPLLSIWHLHTAFFGVSLLYMGYCFMQYRQNIEKLIKKIPLPLCVLAAIILLFLGVFFAFQNSKVSMMNNFYGFLIYFYPSMIFTNLGLIIVLMKLPELKVLTYIGQNTIFYLGTHNIILRVAVSVIPGLNNFEYQLLFFILLFFALIPVVWFVNKYIPFIIGKKHNKKETG